MPKIKALSISEKIQKLKLFNEKIEELRRRNFVKQIFGKEHGVTVNFKADAPLNIEKRGADEESRAALALTLRFFVQERDGIKLEQIAEIYESIPELQEEAHHARSSVQSLQGYLDSSTGFSLGNIGTDPAPGKGVYTNRRLFEAFLWGDMAHANDDKRPDFEALTKKNPFSPVMEWYFEDIVARIVQVIVSFHAMNERTIQFLESHSSAPMAVR